VCPIAVEQRNYYCVYLYINCCHSSQGLFSAVTKYFNQTCPSDNPEKQGVVRNQLVVPRWSDGSETTKKQIRTPSPHQTYLFGENSATELDLFVRLREANDELLAFGVFLPLSRSHARKLLLFVHCLSLSSLEVAGIETCAQRR